MFHGYAIEWQNTTRGALLTYGHARREISSHRLLVEAARASELLCGLDGQRSFRCGSRRRA